MKQALFIFVVLLSLAACKKEEKKWPSSQISFGTHDSLFSTTLNEQRKVWVYVPEGAAKFPDTKYPVVYLLDGDAHFYSVAGLIHQLSTINGNTLCPEMIVVGIPNTDRFRDLTPSHMKEFLGDTMLLRTSGGGENFTKFIADELIPYIDSHYPTTPYRTMIGHSLGGLMVINTIVHHPDLFANYLAIDPSLQWDARKLSKEAEIIFNEKKFNNKFLYVAVANNMPEGMQLPDLFKDTTYLTDHMRAMLEFCDKAKSKTIDGLTFQSHYYPDDDHGSVPLIAEHNALRAMFAWYRLKGIDKFFNPNSTTADELAQFVITHYKNVSAHYGFEMLPQESLVNSLGYAFMGEHMPDKARVMFEMNTRNYPRSANVHDSMGEYYLHQKDTTNAIDQFNQALALADSPTTRDKLKKLKQISSNKKIDQ
ncbi:MAG TPA: alpha/beta hydrolase-fold protein [Cyclobacteriaceae bacterium]|nr:alpha/beta hydrolase-fold protein [Cyclobacteriaceae bacterium]